MEEAENIPGKDFTTIYKLLIRDGIGTRIMETIERGEDFAKMADSLTLSRPALIRRLRFLRELGFEIPKIPNSPLENGRVLDELVQTKTIEDQEAADKKIEEIFSREAINLRIYATGISRGILVSLVPLARRLGFYASRKRVSWFMQALEEAKIPFCILAEQDGGEQQKDARTHILLVAWHGTRAKDAFSKNSQTGNLTVNPVRQVCGEPVPVKNIPTTLRIKKGQGVIPLTDILMRRFGINKNHWDTTGAVKKIILSGFTKPIFSYRGGAFFVPSQYEQELATFLEAFSDFVPEFPAKLTQN